MNFCKRCSSYFPSTLFTRFQPHGGGLFCNWSSSPEIEQVFYWSRTSTLIDCIQIIYSHFSNKIYIMNRTNLKFPLKINFECDSNLSWGKILIVAFSIGECGVRNLCTLTTKKNYILDHLKRLQISFIFFTKYNYFWFNLPVKACVDVVYLFWKSDNADFNTFRLITHSRRIIYCQLEMVSRI